MQAAVLQKARKVEHQHICIAHAARQVDMQNNFFVGELRGVLLNLPRHDRDALNIFIAGNFFVVIEDKAIDARQKFFDTLAEKI